mmetsp:Transcript_15664/g.31513  ORF Transcript_15664/g.31513 Transcript_15664/m.31513 type:complete len:336 (-) Transcript_15664:2282-3289(-)
MAPPSPIVCTPTLASLFGRRGTARPGSLEIGSRGLPMRPATYLLDVRRRRERFSEAHSKPTSTSSLFCKPASLRNFCTFAQTSRAVASSSMSAVGFFERRTTPPPSSSTIASRSPRSPAYSRETLISSALKACPPTSIDPFFINPASSSWPSLAICTCTVLYSLPKRLPSAEWLGTHLKRTSSGLSETRWVTTERTLSSSSTYGSTRWIDSRAGRCMCSTMASGSGVRILRLWRSLIVRPAMMTSWKMAMSVSICSSIALSFTSGIIPKCTDSKRSGSPSGIALTRFCHVSSVKKGVSGAISLHMSSSTSYSVQRECARSSAPPSPPKRALFIRM